MKRDRPGGGFWPRFLFAWFCPGRTAVLAVVITAGSSLPVAAQNLPGNGLMALSYSGQFVITGPRAKSRLPDQPEVKTNASLVVLEPALLSVSAERVKQSLYRLLGLGSDQGRADKIYVALHAAQGTDENVNVLIRPIDRNWSYIVQLPDVVASSRYMRGMTGVLLLELANRQAPVDGHSAEIPPWLIEGLARQLAQNELARVVLTEPVESLDEPRRGRRPAQEHELDPLAAARRLLRDHPALTGDQLNWPTAAQLDGEDGGVYAASAQLLVAELLKLDDGPACLRRMIELLPQEYNWQTAFQAAFHDHFARPLDLEKWWALQVVSFLSHDPGPAWTPAYSAGRLDELLQVPVAVRAASNSLPSHVAVPLQAVVKDFTAVHQVEILEPRLRDLRLAELRMAPRFIALTDAYCRVLAEYLGERLEPAPRAVYVHHAASAPARLGAREFARRLDALDTRRRALESALAGRPGFLEETAFAGHRAAR